MKKNRHITAFYLETILLIVVFMTIIMVLTQVFGAGKAQSSAAKRLTNAINLAENAAEAVSASDSPEAVLALLNEKDNAAILEGGPVTTIEARYSEEMKPDPEGRFRIDVTWKPQEQGAEYIASDISVLFGENRTPVYTLETGVYIKGVDR